MQVRWWGEGDGILRRIDAGDDCNGLLGLVLICSVFICSMGASSLAERRDRFHKGGS